MERLPWFERSRAASLSRVRPAGRQAWPESPLKTLHWSLSLWEECGVSLLDNQTEELRTPHPQLFAFS